VVAADDPLAADVRELLELHLRFAAAHSPPQDMHALGVMDLLGGNVQFFSVRERGELLGVGAVKHLDDHHAELKSVHTAEAARRRGVARRMVAHLVSAARARGCTRVSLETGSMEAFAPSRALYRSAGFELCEPFGSYVASPNSVFMTLVLDRETV